MHNMQMRAWVGLSLLLGSVAVGGQACGSAGVQDDSGLTPEQVCRALFGAECDKSCEASTDCSTGMHCKSGTCAAECGGERYTCSSGRSCTTDGRCSEGGLLPLPGDNGSGGSGNDCVDVTVEFEKEIPNVVLLVDQSGSMCSLFGSKSRWATVKDVLIGQTGEGEDRGIVGELASEVRFGLTTYAAQVRTNGACNASNSATGSIVTGFALTPLVVPLALDNFEAINDEFRPLAIGRGTPTGQAYEATVEALLADEHSGSKIIVLATDGAPGLYNTSSGDVASSAECCPGGECSPSTCGSTTSCGTGSSQTCAKNRVVNAVNLAYPDIRTFVISVGTGSVAVEHLQEVANVGQGLPRNTSGEGAAKYYESGNQEDLVNAFREIIDGVRSCVFALGGEVDLAAASGGSVRLNGVALEMNNQANGWRLNNSSEIELLGQACEDIKSGDPNLEIKFPCGAVIVR
jgi:hypothetical protein